MSDREVSATEAARALREVEERRDQGQKSQPEARWVSVVFGLIIFAGLAAPDFLDQNVSSWLVLAIPVGGVLYTLMLRSRRGNALLGRPVRLRKEEISPRVLLASRLVLVAGAVVIVVVMRFVDVELFPYARTVVGALLGIGLIVFGPRLQRVMTSPAARRDDGLPDGAEHESR